MASLDLYPFRQELNGVANKTRAAEAEDDTALRAAILESAARQLRNIAERIDMLAAEAAAAAKR